MIEVDVDFGKSVFICSKPLQAINCLSIKRHYGLLEARIFIVESSFASCAAFINLVSRSSHSQQCEFQVFESHAEAARALVPLDYDSLFIEDDRASMYNLLAPHKRKYLCVFEEGIGTYVQLVHYRLNTLKGLKWRFIAPFSGCGTSFGEGRETDFVFVHDTKLYRRVRKQHRATVLPFPGVLDELTRTQDAWYAELENVAPSLCCPKGNVALILGTWSSSHMKLRQLVDSKHDEVFYKAHPHDNSRPDEKWQEIHVQHVPAEALVSYLSAVSQSLTVYHFQSSTAFYCRDAFPNVKFIDLRPADPAIGRVLRFASVP